ncbi:hypothetical protein, partial [Campylobacter concisus]|uniref:hypothetical protein n=1 Tax=Campylobacter concisus TaxID=199 RepID=UPI001CA312EB
MAKLTPYFKIYQYLAHKNKNHALFLFFYTALKFSTNMITLSAFWKNTRFGLNLPQKNTISSKPLYLHLSRLF